MEKKTARILVVDDETIVRESIARTLKQSGYECYQAANGIEALKILNDINFELVLLDISMPKMSGTELLPQIKTSWPDTWVMMLTATIDTTIAVQCMKMGAVDYLMKPFDCNDVLGALNKTLKKRGEELQKQELEQKSHTKMRERVVKENEYRAEFLLSVAHEVKTPLTSIIASTELLTEDANSFTSEQRQHLVDIIAKTSWRLNSKLTEITDALSPSQKHLSPEYEPLDVTNLLKEIVLQCSAYYLKSKKQMIMLEISDTLPALIADGKMFVKIVRNMLSYASLHSPSGGKIVLKASSNNNAIDIKVTDSAPSLSEEEKELIFQPSYECHRSEEKSDTAGFGVDMPLAQKYARAHGGELCLDAAASGGNTFIFSCPLQPKITKSAETLSLK